MKWLPVLSLMFLISCEEKIPQYKKKSAIETQRSNSTSASKAIVHLRPRIKIDSERQEIEVTGHSGQLCGIDFQDGQILRYQLINESELEIVLENETLKLTRIHNIGETGEAGLYGDWQNVNFSEDSENHRERIVTFFIRDNETMNVDVYCEEKEGKLFEDFQ